LEIDLGLRVESIVTANPASVDFIYAPCIEPLAPREQDVALSASTPLSYTAQIEGNPNWITVAPLAGTLPETVTVEIDPALRPANAVAPDLLVTVDTPTVSGVAQRIPIYFACAQSRINLPRVFR
jgi:hypothetical protein